MFVINRDKLLQQIRNKNIELPENVLEIIMAMPDVQGEVEWVEVDSNKLPPIKHPVYLATQYADGERSISDCGWRDKWGEWTEPTSSFDDPVEEKGRKVTHWAEIPEIKLPYA